MRLPDCGLVRPRYCSRLRIGGLVSFPLGHSGAEEIHHLPVDGPGRPFADLSPRPQAPLPSPGRSASQSRCPGPAVTVGLEASCCRAEAQVAFTRLSHTPGQGTAACLPRKSGNPGCAGAPLWTTRGKRSSVLRGTALRWGPSGAGRALEEGTAPPRTAGAPLLRGDGGSERRELETEVKPGRLGGAGPR